MSKNDALDLVLRKIKTEEEWQKLLVLCECGDRIDLKDYTNEGLVKRFNKEIRSNYGNVLVNAVRNNYEPDYDKMLKYTAKKVGVQYIPLMETLSLNDVEYLEREIFVATLKNIKKKVVEDNGIDAWTRIEEMAGEGVFDYFKNDKITKEEYEQIKTNLDDGDLISLISVGKVSGFIIYIVEECLTDAVNKYLGLGVYKPLFFDPVVVMAATIVANPMSLFRPVFWILPMIKAKQQKMLGIIIYIAALRQKQNFETRLLS